MDSLKVDCVCVDYVGGDNFGDLGGFVSGTYKGLSGGGPPYRPYRRLILGGSRPPEPSGWGATALFWEAAFNHRTQGLIRLLMGVVLIGVAKTGENL